MSGFDLVPVDGGGDPVHVPQGDTVLGRGPFLGVSDKRVSRHHGLLQNLNGQLSLKPTHTNPCFVQSSLTDEPRPLQRDSWHRLHHGDLFSLLPGQLVFKVEAMGGEERTPRDSPMLDEEAGLPVSPELDADSPPAVGRDQTLAPPSHEEKDERLKQDDQRNVAPSRPRRVLPAWMLASAAAPKTPSSTLKVQSSVKRRKKPAAASAVSQATPTTSTSPKGVGLSEEDEEEEKRPRKKRRRISDEEEEEEEERQTRTDASPEDVTVGELRPDVSEGHVSTPASEVKKPDKKNKNDSASKPGVRTPCPFGKDCYRKNPLHFQECSHPGDTDYKEEEEEEEDEDRPECPYGTDCYRKNPLHRKEYKHTKKPARSTRTVATKDEDDDGEDSEDADSFINDDSEDAGDDSDYVPPDSDDSGKEDIKRLQREARVFLKRKK